MDAVLTGIATAFSVQNLAFCFLGVTLGTFIGVLPGLGGLAAVSLLLPISFYLEPTTALIMLAGVYYGGEYGGSTASILLKLPGDASNAITCLDGHEMTRQGRAGVALFTAAIGSFIGGSTAIVLLMVLTPVLVKVALSFGPAEYFAAMTFGLLAAATIAQGAPLKGMAMVLMGLLLGTIGTDVNSGVERYTFGFLELLDGFSVVIIGMGMFGIAEVISSVMTARDRAYKGRISISSMLPTREDVRRAALPIARGTGIGALFGVLPGTGPTISAFMAYVIEKRISRTPERFGRGAIEGVAAPESANNAAAQASFIPTLALGIPGSASMAIMLGAMMIHGITPGPRMMIDHQEVFWGLVISFWIGNVMLLVLNIPLINVWVRVLQVPYRFLYPAIVCVVCIGVFSINNSVFEVWLVLMFGLAGYLMRLLGFEPAPLMIGFILGPMVEENLRRAMRLAGGDFLAILERPITAAILGMTALLFLWIVYGIVRSKTRMVDRLDDLAQG